MFLFDAAEKIAEASRKFANLKSELGASEAEENWSTPGLRNRGSTGFVKALFREKEPTTKRKLHDIKLAFSEFYLNLILLENYQNLNFTGFRKILKKHDKVIKYIFLKVVSTIFKFNYMIFISLSNLKMIQYNS